LVRVANKSQGASESASEGALPGASSGAHARVAPAKRSYHHGDLREALIEAATTIVRERGAEHFTVSDACRLAGVSTAAPYKHFRDRNEILEEVVQRAFAVLADRGVDAARASGEGTLAGIVAMNLAYVDYAIEEQGLFRLMFGQHPDIKQDEDVLACGQSCFSRVVEQFEFFCRRNQIDEDPTAVCLRVWTFVHGMAYLLMDEDYSAVAPGLDHRALLMSATPMLLGVDAQT